MEEKSLLNKFFFPLSICALIAKIRAMRKLGVEELLVSAVMSMYTGAKTVVKTVYGNSRGCEALSPLLLVIVMEAISREFRVALPGSCCMLMTWL